MMLLPRSDTSGRLMGLIEVSNDSTASHTKSYKEQPLNTSLRCYIKLLRLFSAFSLFHHAPDRNHLLAATELQSYTRF